MMVAEALALVIIRDVGVLLFVTKAVLTIQEWFTVMCVPRNMVLITIYTAAPLIIR